MRKAVTVLAIAWVTINGALAQNKKSNGKKNY
jgi:hypothetical protein